MTGITNRFEGVGEMGKYIIWWILGVPASLLVVIYVLSHIF